MALVSTASASTPPSSCANVAFVSGNDNGNFARAWVSNGNGTFHLAPVTTTGFFRNGTGTQVFGTDNFQFTTYADVTRDGLSDLIHVTEDGHSIFVYPNVGNGRFQTTPISTTNMQTSTDPAAGFTGVTNGEQGWFADTNADGNLDYIFSGVDAKVHVYLGNGNGTFATTRVTSTLNESGRFGTSGRTNDENFMMGDVTGDGVTDLVGTAVVDGTSPFYIWKGNGNGTFQADVYFLVHLQQSNGGSNSLGVGAEEYSQLADADGDGDLDYVHATGRNGHAQILVFKNNGDGTFGPLQGGLLIGQSTTGFALPNNFADSFADVTSFEHSFFQDLNGDGAADYIWSGTSAAGNGIYVWLNNGTGSFSTSFIYSPVSNFQSGDTNGITTGIACVTALDIDSDGVPDRIDLDSDNDGILDSVEIGSNLNNPIDSDSDGFPDYLDLDSDNDGINDVVEAGGIDANGNGLADGTDANGDGIIDSHAAAPIDTDGDGLRNYRDLDSDNDGIFDLMEADSGCVDANNDGRCDDTVGGDGIPDTIDNLNGFGSLNKPAPTDTDGDGAPDYVDLDSDNDGISDNLETGIQLVPSCLNVAIVSGNDSGNFARAWVSNGDGTFHLAPATTTGFFRNGTGTQVFGTDNFQFTTYADVTRDGLSDLLHVTEDGHSIFVYPNVGNGRFQTTPIVTTNMQTSTDPAAGFAGVTNGEQGWFADTNGDGNLDYIFSGVDAKVHVYFGNGNGTFATSRITSALNESGRFGTSGRTNDENFMMGDVTGDGVADLVGTAVVDGTSPFYIWKGNGNGTFQADVYFLVHLQQSNGGSNSLGVGAEEYSQLADADGDGDLDYIHATGRNGHAQILVFKNNGDGTFGPLQGGVLIGQSTTGFALPNNSADSFADVTSFEHSFFQDLNGDGAADYIWSGTSAAGNGIYVWHNNGTGSFSTSFIFSAVSNFQAGETNGIATGIACVTALGNDTTLLDTDGDGTPNYRDLDSDGDDRSDYRLTDVIEGGNAAADTNGDGVINSSDTNGGDSDGDGIPNSVDGLNGFGDAGSPAFTDIDGDGTPDYLDGDSDNDGIPDRLDQDDDNDRIIDAVEIGFGGGDADGDGIPSRLDLDSDNDGINDIIEAGGVDANGDGRADGTVDGNGIPAPGAITLLFSDNDARANPYDLDSDNDGVSDLVENGYGAFDTNNDGFLSTADSGVTDSDRDGIMSVVDGSPLWGDAGDPGLRDGPDGDNIPNVLDLDSDGDGVFDNREAGRSAFDVDNNGLIDDTEETDLDGIRDSIDSLPGAFGGLSSVNIDGDGDGVSDFLDLDSDNDGIPDSVEGATDTDGDGAPNYIDLDSDNDGLNDVEEVGGLTDANRDGFADGTDANGDGVIDSPATAPVDSEGDGTPDYLDLDSDNDGIGDVIEGGNAIADTNGDGVINTLDTNGTPGFDGIPDSVDRLNGFGSAGNIALPDTDGDGVPNYRDADDDNDGINTSVECPAGAPCPNSDYNGIATPLATNVAFKDVLNLELPTGGYDLKVVPAAASCADPALDLPLLTFAAQDLVEVYVVGNIGNLPLTTVSTKGLFVVPDGNPATVTIAHLAPFANSVEGTSVTVRVNGADVLTNFTFGTLVSVALPAGDYLIEILPTGTNTVAISANVTLAAGVDYTAAAIGDGANQPLELLPLVDNNTVISDKARVRIVHLAPFANTLDGTRVNVCIEGDGTPDYLDLDSDNDGVSDVIEGGNAIADTNGDGVINALDTNGTPGFDGIPDSVDGLRGFGSAGNTALPDTDSDGVPNYRDADDDNDGINTSVECPAGSPCPNSDYNGVATPLATNVAFKDVLNLELPTGGYDLKVVPAAASCADPALDLPLLTFAAQDLVEVYVVGNIGNLPLTTVSTKGLFVAPGGNVATVTIAHLAPFANSVDGTSVTVRVNGADVLTNFKFGSVVKDLALPAGSYLIEILPTGTNTVAISANVTLAAGVDYTAAAIGDGVNQPLELLPLVDNNTIIADKARVRIVHLAPFANTLDGTRVNVCIEGDGIPDYLDADSDNDGFTDEEENNFPSDPVNPNSIPGVAISAKVLLQGALINPNNPAVPLAVMRDDIRSRNLLPLTSPYTGTAVVTATTALFAANGNDSVVDWVQLELRNAVTPTTVVASLAVLVQRDGDVMDVTGSTTLVFRGVPVGSYFVAVSHRNHLGTMTAAPVSLSGTATAVDFTSTAADFFNAAANLNGVEQATVDGKFALWTGDANGDGRVAFSGQNNDVDAIFTAIDGAPGNLLGLPSFVLNGYRSTDVDLTGSTIFTGEDVNTIFNTIDGHPRNLLGLPTYVIVEQLP